MTSTHSHRTYLSKTFLIFITVLTMLAIAGGYQLSRIFSQVDQSAVQRSAQLLDIEESLDDAAIGLGRQVQEWKDMLLRANDKARYDFHQNAFRESSIGVQYALLEAKTTMRDIGMDTADIDHLISEHKSLLSEYLIAHSKLKPSMKESSGQVDMQIVGIDRKLQRDIASVKAGISAFAKQQMYRTPETQGNRYWMIGLLGATSLFFMAMFGFVFSQLTTRQ